MLFRGRSTLPAQLDVWKGNMAGWEQPLEVLTEHDHGTGKGVSVMLQLHII
jgi:hypothetical protein